MKTPEERIKRMNERSNLSNFLNSASLSTAIYSSAPYQMPTFLASVFEVYKERRYGKTEAQIQEDKKKKELTDMVNEDALKTFGLGMLTGMGLGTLINIAQVGVYGYLAFNGLPEALLIPATTNLISGISVFRKSRAKKSEVHNLAEQLRNAVTFGVSYKVGVEIPSAEMPSIVYIKYMASNPPKIRVETCWSQPEALKPEHHKKEFVEFIEGEKYLDDIYNPEVIGVLERKFSLEKNPEIVKNLRRAAK